MAGPVNLYKEWKVPLSKSNYRPVAVQASMFDLMFYYDSENVIRPRYTPVQSITNFRNVGLTLQHNIIAFDEKAYRVPDSSRGELPRGYRVLSPEVNVQEEYEDMESTQVSFERWSKIGFDIALPKFDSRHKPSLITVNNYEKAIAKDLQHYIDYETFLMRGVDENIVFPFDAEVTYEEIIDFLNLMPFATNDFFYNPALNKETSITINTAFKVFNKNAAIKFTNTHEVYTNSILFTSDINQDNYNTWTDYSDPYTVASENDLLDAINADIILCGKDLNFEERFLEEDSGFSAYNALCLNMRSPRVWRNFFRYYNSRFNFDERISLNDFLTGPLVHLEAGNVNRMNPILAFMLKNCYVWVKCSFFADYIDYQDFDQYLNKEADVIHKNMILTNYGDFRKYSGRFSDRNATVLEDSFKDSRAYIPVTTPSVDILADNLLPFNPRLKTMPLEEKIDLIIDDSHKTESKIGSLPIEPFVIGSGEHNITAQVTNGYPPVWFDPDGRTPAEDYNDEPTLMGKSGNIITSGRVISPTIDELWIMIKRLVEGRKPSDYQITETNEDETEELEIGILGYPRGKNEFDTSIKLKKHRFEVDNKEVIGDPIDIAYTFDNDFRRGEFEVKSWVDTPTDIEYVLMKELIEVNTDICAGIMNPELLNRIRNMPSPEFYKPFVDPLSLRELESLIKGLRWNLAYYMTYVKNVKVFNGSIKRRNSDTQLDEYNRPIPVPYNLAAGGLYQLHKDYETDDSKKPGNCFYNPNTIYDERYNRNEAPSDAWGTGVAKIGVDEFSSNKEVIPAWSVYMAADGTWHSSRQALLVPLRNDEKW